MCWGDDLAFSSHPLGIVNESSSTPFPATVEKSGVACYDFDTQDLLDCHFTFKITELVNNGGHLGHTPALHPLVDPGKANLEYDGIDKDGSPLGIDSQTEEKRAIINIPLSEVAGAFEVEIITDSPKGYVCARSCFTDKSHKRVHTFDVRIGGLGPLGGGPFLNLQPSDFHGSENHFGSGAMVQKIISLGLAYNFDTGESLRILNMSLPNGGLFDVMGDWSPPHKSHRKGTSVDVSRFINAAGTIITGQDRLDRIAIKEVGGLRRFTEKYESECPVFKPGDPPCIHYELNP